MCLRSLVNIPLGVLMLFIVPKYLHIISVIAIVIFVDALQIAHNKKMPSRHPDPFRKQSQIYIHKAFSNKPGSGYFFLRSRSDRLVPEPKDTWCITPLSSGSSRQPFHIRVLFRWLSADLMNPTMRAKC